MFKSMIHEFEEKLLSDIMNEAKDPIDASVKAAVAEWKELSKKMAVIEKISKAVAARITEVEKGLEEVVGKVKDRKAVVDGAILEYTQKKGNTTVKYKESVDYALKLVNEAQKKVLEDFIKSVTKPGAITDVLKVTDPDLEKYLIDLKDLKGEELMNKIETMARSGFDNIPKLASKDKKKVVKEGVMDNITKVVSHLVRTFKSVFSGFFKANDKADKAAESLLKAVKATSVQESVEAVAELKNHMDETEFTSFASWKSACRKVDPQYWLDGDKDIATAMVGPKPFVKGKTQGIGEWDGEVGTIYGDAHLNEEETVEEAKGPKVIKQTPEGGVPAKKEEKSETKPAAKAEGKKKVSAAQRRKLDKTKKAFREVSDKLEALNLDTDEKIGRDHPLVQERKKLADELTALNKEFGIKMH